jgi:hypothetical protein
MMRFIEGQDRDQATLFPQRLDEAIGADNPVRGPMPLLMPSATPHWTSALRSDSTRSTRRL